MKLVGTYRAVVTDVSMGNSAKGKPGLKVHFDVTDELINGDWVPMETPRKESKFYTLSTERKPGSKKSGAEVTAEMIKETYDHVGGISKIGDIVFKVVHLVCGAHDGKWTQIDWVNNPNKAVKGNYTEFSDTTIEELDRIFLAAQDGQV